MKCTSILDIYKLFYSALTTDDERRQLSHLITTFIRQVNFGRDFEQQLDFYVNARAAFSNLDMVLKALVQVSQTYQFLSSCFVLDYIFHFIYMRCCYSLFVLSIYMCCYMGKPDPFRQPVFLVEAKFEPFKWY